MRLSEFRGEEALEVLADLIEPIVEILADPDVKTAFEKEGTTRAKLASIILKKHKKSVLRIMAISEQKNPETYSPKFFEIPKKVIDLLNDPDVVNLFISQAQTTDSTSSGSALENTQE